ncbi:MAG TPA: hypothetical protein VNL98_10320, partial [Gemmatimonadales bacterium]|nr:hypothetical protein [Gemmatimonadales bacterium]
VPSAVGETGTLEVRVSGLASSAAGTVTVTRPDGTDPGVTVAMPNADSQGVSLGVATGVPVGTYRIAYTPPSSHLLTDASNTKDVTVSANSSARADFTVQAVGTLEVRVSGFAAGATSAGSVAVTRPDGSPSGVSVSLPTPSNGASLGTAPNTPVGTYRVTYTPPSGYARTDSSAFKDIAVGVGQSARAEFGVRELSAGPALVFASDWRAATGSTVAAVGDGGKWDVVNLSALDVVVNAAAQGLTGWPSTNALRLEYNTPSSGAHGVTKAIASAWSAPNVGETLYFRYYVWVGLSGVDSGCSNHPIQHAPGAGSQPLWVKFEQFSGNSFVYTLEPQNAQNHYHRWQVNLTRNTTYRLEYKVTRTGSETFDLSARVYDGNNTLLFDDDDFLCNQFGHNNHKLNSVETAFDVAAANVARLGGMMIVDQGCLNRPGEYICYGAFAVSQVDWCGEYRPGEAS